MSDRLTTGERAALRCQMTWTSLTCAGCATPWSPAIWSRAARRTRSRASATGLPARRLGHAAPRDENRNGRLRRNIKIGPLHPHRGTADLGIMIGDLAATRRGIDSEAIMLAT